MPAEGRLEVVEGAQKGTVVPLAASPVTFGRAPGNGFVVKDATVSRQHAKVFERDERHFIADLNSSHGTFVNGLKVTLHSLTPGDVVKLGGTTLRYCVGAAAPAAGLPTGPPAAPAAAPSAAPPVASAPAPIAAPGGDAFELELELPTVTDARPPAAPPKAPTPSPLPLAPPPAPAKPLPPVNPNYRRALAATGEDPFADDAPPSAPEASAAAAAAPAAPSMPSIELRGRTAEHFATRGGTTAGGAARPASGAAAVHVPPPLARLGRSKGPLSILRGDLDQRGGSARLVAAVFALAIAGGLLWATMKLFGSGPAKEAPREDQAPLGPERPSLPPKR